MYDVRIEFINGQILYFYLPLDYRVVEVAHYEQFVDTDGVIFSVNTSEVLYVMMKEVPNGNPLKAGRNDGDAGGAENSYSHPEVCNVPSESELGSRTI